MSPTLDYLSFVLSFTNMPPISVLALFLLGFMRIAPIVALAPFLGQRVPGVAKMALVVCITVIMLPHLLTTLSHPIYYDVKYMILILKELFIGTILALIVSIPFYIAESAGVIIDFLRGSSALQVTDPSTQVEVSPVGLLYNYVLIVLFFEINGFYYFLDAVTQSYTFIPPDAWLSPAFFSLKLPFWQMIMHVLTNFTSLSIQFAAPSIVAILMAEMFLGIANRLAPQVQIAFLGMSIKSLLGIALLFAGWFFILQQMSKQTLLMLQDLQRLLPTFPISH